jgi:hypothetical protein
MFNDFDFHFSQHEQNVRRGVANAALVAALRPERRGRPKPPQSGGLVGKLRRIAGSPAAA